MAMELQLGTGQAQAALKQVEQSLSSLRAQLEKFSGANTGFDTFVNRLNAFQGVNRASIQSLNDLAASVRSISSAPSITALSNALTKLAATDVSQAATHVRSLAAALNSLRVPSALQTMTTQLSQFSIAARSAAMNAQNLSAALSTIQAPAAAAAAAKRQVGQAAQQAAAGTGQFSTNISQLTPSLTSANAVLRSFGLGLSAVYFGRMLKDAIELRVEMDKFNAIMNNLQGPKAAGKNMEFLWKVADETAISVRTLMSEYPKWVSATQTGGYSAAESAKMYLQLSKVMTSLGLNTEDSKGAMKAFTQMAQKGTISMEELRQQLGDRGVPAINAMAKALGVTVQQLDGLARAGAIPASALGKLITELEKQFGGALPAMLNGFAAGMTRLENMITKIEMAFTGTFTQSIGAAMGAVTAALNLLPLDQVAADIGSLIGSIGGLVIVVGGALVGAFALATTGITGFATLFNQLLSSIAYFVGGVALGLIEIVNGIASGIAWAAQAVWSWVTSFEGIATAAAWVGTAIYDWIITPILKLLDAVGVLQYFAAVWEFLKNVVNGFLEIMKTIWSYIQPVLAGIFKWAEATSILSDKFDIAKSSLKRFTAGAEESKATATELASKMSQLSDATVSSGDAADDGADKFKKLANGMDETIFKADKLAGNLNKVADATYHVASANAAASSSSGGLPWFGTRPGQNSLIEGSGHIWDDWGGSMFDGYAGGGIAGEPSGMRVFAPHSAFANAPQFAGGGTTNDLSPSLAGGGIPAILHPNEAVVPLTGGGQIPVHLSGDVFQGSTRRSGGLPDTDNVVEAIRVFNVMFKNESDKHYALLLKIYDALGKLESKLSSATSTRTPTGGGSLPSTPSATPGYQVGKDFGATGGGTGKFPGKYTGPSWKFLNGQLTYSVDGQAINPFTNAPANPSSGGGGSSSATAASMQKSTGDIHTISQQADGTLVLARGTANTSRDGIPAILHPNEAVIPLPDGRRVPVDVSGWEPDEPTARHRELNDDITGELVARRTQRAPVTVNVSLTVNTPDADSFRRSKDQTMQELRAGIERAVANIGSTPAVDDPTRR